MAINSSEQNGHALDLLGRAEAAYVTTLDERGRPQTRAMFNLRNSAQFPGLMEFFRARGANFTTYFTTNTSSSKMADLVVHSAVSVYYCIPDEFSGLMLGGDMEIVKDSAIKKVLWQPGWEMYYRGGPEDPDHTVLRLVPAEAKLYYKLTFARLL
jgi:general stress protein 26